MFAHFQAGGLHDSDFEWMTAQLVAIAESSCEGRLVSTLEGGYRVTGGPLASLGRAAAAHVSTLMQPALVSRPWEQDDALDRLHAMIEQETRWQEARAARRAAARAAAIQAAQAAEAADAAADAAAAAAAAGDSSVGAASDAPAAVAPVAVAADASALVERAAAAKAALEAESDLGGGGSRRSKRARTEVDYVALEAKMKGEDKNKSE